jgi:hypothetical protein
MLNLLPGESKSNDSKRQYHAATLGRFASILSLESARKTEGVPI